ncbi:MAG: ABC transporter substrate-binding protein [Cyanophyceae cyanobacterium]
MKIRNTGRALAAIALAAGALVGCEDPAGTGGASGGADGLKLGALLPATGDLSSIGQPMLEVLPLLVDQVNACGGVNGSPVTLITADDQTDPTAGAEGMTKLTEVDGVAGVVGSFASSVSMAGADVAARNEVMMISPGSTSPLFTERAANGDFKGFWARTAPPDTYQAEALAQLASDRGFKTVATVAINNDYGIEFEQRFIEAFEKLGGTVVNADNPTRYDPKAATFTTEASAAFGEKPDAVAAILYVETGALLLKAAYEQGLTEGVQVMLTDGVKTEEFPTQVGKDVDGKPIIAGAIGTVPGADGVGLAALERLIDEKLGKAPSAFVPQTWDAMSLLMLAAQAAQENTGAGIQSKLLDVANGPGEEVNDICEGLKLLQEGKDINFQGASGNVDIDENGDVVGNYDVWTVQDTGEIDVTDKVELQGE